MFCVLFYCKVFPAVLGLYDTLIILVYNNNSNNNKFETDFSSYRLKTRMLIIPSSDQLKVWQHCRAQM